MPEETVQQETAPEGAAEELDLEGDLTEEQYPKEYVGKLRAEAAARRVEAKTAKEAVARFEAFTKLPESDVDILAQIVQHIASPDPELQKLGAQAFMAIGRDLLGEETETPKEETPPVQEQTNTENEPLTAAKVQELVAAALAERDTQTKTQQDTAQRQAEFDKWAKDQGYDKDTDEYGYTALLKAVVKHGDRDKALEDFKSWEQKRIDAFVEGRQGDKGVRPPTGAGAGTKTVEPPKSLADATAAFKQMLESNQAV